MFDQARAILWAQWRTLWNFYSRGNLASLLFSTTMAVIWYGLWSVGAVSVAILSANPAQLPLVARLLPRALLLALLYWQIVPILMASTGASLDLKRLLICPIPRTQLFILEVLLRLTTGLEMILVLAGATVGLLLNPVVPNWAPLGFLPFVIMNLYLAAGLRDLLGRLLMQKYVREAFVFLFVLLAALPQLFIVFGMPPALSGIFTSSTNPIWPWSAVAQIALGEKSIASSLVVIFWTLAAYMFGRWQFERNLRFDADEARATREAAVPAERWSEKFYRLPSVLFSDPLGALVEKEVRFLSRTPRFRLVFLMGFSFGLLIWMPLALRDSGHSAFANNYLTFVSIYALLLLGEVSFWNSFGFDRSAAQLYFLVPVSAAKVLEGKNIAAAIFVLLEVTAVAIVCALLRMPVSAPKLLESYAVTCVLTVYLLAAGNVGSTHFPRPVNPVQSWRSASAGRFQALMLVVYPVLSIPVMLAYGARYAFDSNTAFYAVLAFAAVLGAVFYWVALDSAVSAIAQRQEKLLAALAAGEGPVST